MRARCAFDGCPNNVNDHGLCMGHSQQRKKGKPLTASIKRPVMVRLWERVDRSGGQDACWPYTKGRFADGYGCITTGNRTIGTHRLVLEEKLGRKLVDGEHAMHACDNPPCCNPAHLSAGTNEENQEDCRRKGRSRSEKLRGNSEWGRRMRELQCAR